MENNELLRRCEDLSERAERTGRITFTPFLTPAEAYEVKKWAAHGCEAELRLFGGQEDCERVCAFFLPSYLPEDEFCPEETIRAIRIHAYFGEPGHRDYMGSLLGMGIEREFLGDIRVNGAEADVFCMKSIAKHLLGLDKVGRCGVKCGEIALSDAVQPQRSVKVQSFSVMSPRLDAVAAGMFRLSRSECAKLIGLGMVIVNYSVSQKPDFCIHEGDIISLRGAGKGTVTEIGGESRKGRTFVTAEILK